MAEVHALHFEVDREQPIAPQVITLRGQRVPWWMIERLTGRKKRRLEEAVARWRERKLQREAATLLR